MAALDRADAMVALGDHADGVVMALRVVPRAPRTAVVGRYGDAIKLKVAAPPADGAANDEVRRFLADLCGIRAGDVEILAGERSRDKVVLLRGASPTAVLAGLTGR